MAAIMSEDSLVGSRDTLYEHEACKGGPGHYLRCEGCHNIVFNPKELAKISREVRYGIEPS